MTIIFGKNKRLIFYSRILTVCTIAAVFLVQCSGSGNTTVFEKQPLPYRQDALTPTISAQAMELHYDKHYAGYVKKANQLIRRMTYAGKTPESVIQIAAGDPAQAWNHVYFFNCIKPDGGGEPEGVLAEMIESTFGSFADFKKLFLTAAGDQFGSGV